MTFFKTIKQTESARLKKIALRANTHDRVQDIVDFEFKRMLNIAEEVALKGEMTFVFDLDIKEKDQSYSNEIIYGFIDKLYAEEFNCTRILSQLAVKFRISFK